MNAAAPRSLTPGQMKELTTVLAQAIPNDMPFWLAERWLAKKTELKERIWRQMWYEHQFGWHSSRVSAQINEWALFYETHFKLSINVEEIFVPAHWPGFDQLIIVPQGISINDVYRFSKEHFPCKSYVASGMESEFSRNERSAEKKTYAVWCEKVEDPPTSNHSSREESWEEVDLRQRNRMGLMTIMERMLYGLKYFTHVQHHLDKKRQTCCGGTNLKHPGILHPYVGWSKFGYLEITFTPTANFDRPDFRRVIA